MSTIRKLLKTVLNSRLSVDDKWLVWWEGEWLVLQRPYAAKKNRVLYRGLSQDKALAALKGGEAHER